MKLKTSETELKDSQILGEPIAVKKPVRIENEIPCPRCSDVMILCYDFDELYYSCEECGMILSDFRK